MSGVEVGPSKIALPRLARQRVGAKNWKDEQRKVLVLQAVAHQAYGEKDMPVQLLGHALALTVLGGFIRLFVNEGTPMAHLWTEATQGIMPDYFGKLLAVFEAEEQKSTGDSQLPPPSSLSSH